MTASATTRTPRQIYDLVRQREIALELLPEGEVKEKVRVDLARLRVHAKTLETVHKVGNRKSRS